MSGKIRKKKGGDLKSHKISTLHAKGRNPSVSMHTKDARVAADIKQKGGKNITGDYWYGRSGNAGEGLPPKGIASTFQGWNKLRITADRILGVDKVPGIEQLYASGYRGIKTPHTGQRRIKQGTFRTARGDVTSAYLSPMNNSGEV